LNVSALSLPQSASTRKSQTASVIAPGKESCRPPSPPSGFRLNDRIDLPDAAAKDPRTLARRDAALGVQSAWRPTGNVARGRIVLKNSDFRVDHFWRGC